MGTRNLSDSERERLARTLRVRLEQEIDPWPTWRGGWPGESDTALDDAVFSTRTKYEPTVLSIVGRWREARNGLGPQALGVSAFRRIGRARLHEIIDNDQVAPGTKTLKVDVVLELAELLLNHSPPLDTASEITRHAATHTKELRHLLQSVPGVGRATSAYFLMLLGVEGVKADTLVTAWVSARLQEHPSTCRPLSQAEVEDIVRHTARLMGKSLIDVDHAIWRTESTRRAGRSRSNPR